MYKTFWSRGPAHPGAGARPRPRRRRDHAGEPRLEKFPTSRASKQRERKRTLLW